MLEVDPEDVSDELEPYLEPTMYVKDHLRRQLIAGGGKILERFDHSQLLEDDDTVLVVCNRPCRTERYIRSLAARIRAVSHDWVIHCCQVILILLESVIIFVNEFLISIRSF